MSSLLKSVIFDADLYDYAVVTSGWKKEQLYVLCRDRVRFNQFYEKDVLSYLAGAGFTGFFNRPRPTKCGKR